MPVGTSQMCTKTHLHEGWNMHERTLLPEDTFGRRVILTKTFLHESKKKQINLKKKK